MPVGATPIDFAVAMHTQLGMHISGAKLNGKLISLDTPLQNGDILEIQTNRKAHPTRKWLDIVKTSLARKHIKNYLQRTR